MPDRLFTPSEVSRICGIASSTIFSLMAFGHLKSIQMEGEKPLISEAEILRFCDKKWKQISDPTYTGRKFRMFSPDEIRRHLQSI